MSDANRDEAQIVDLVADYSQRAIELITSSDIARQIPIVKTAMAAVAAIRTVRDAMLVQKLESFLDPLATVAEEDRHRMIARLESEPKYRGRVGETIIEILDRIEKHRKPRMVGEVFAALARGTLDVMVLQRLVGAIERLPGMEIDTVRRFVHSANDSSERDKIDRESILALINAGFAEARASNPIGGGQSHYVPTPTCQKFVELQLDQKSADPR